MPLSIAANATAPLTGDAWAPHTSATITAPDCGKALPAAAVDVDVHVATVFNTTTASSCTPAATTSMPSFPATPSASDVVIAYSDAVPTHAAAPHSAPPHPFVVDETPISVSTNLEPLLEQQIVQLSQDPRNQERGNLESESATATATATANSNVSWSLEVFRSLPRDAQCMVICDKIDKIEANLNVINPDLGDRQKIGTKGSWYALVFGAMKALLLNPGSKSPSEYSYPKEIMDLVAHIHSDNPQGAKALGRDCPRIFPSYSTVLRAQAEAQPKLQEEAKKVDTGVCVCVCVCAVCV